MKATKKLPKKRKSDKLRVTDAKIIFKKLTNRCPLYIKWITHYEFIQRMQG